MILVFENSTLGGKHVLFEGVGSLRVHMLAGRLGFEPRYADPESAVLPLDDLPIKSGFIPAFAGTTVAPFGLCASRQTISQSNFVIIPKLKLEAIPKPSFGGFASL